MSTLAAAPPSRSPGPFDAPVPPDEHAAVDDVVETVDHVTVRFGGGRYGICAPDVAEVVAVPVVTRLPGAPGWLLGIGNWRGHVLPLVDLRPLLGLVVTPLPSSARTVVLAVDGIEVGLLAEAVTGLSPVPQECSPPPATIDAGAAALLRGIADGGASGPLGVIDTTAVLALRDRVPRARRDVQPG